MRTIIIIILTSIFPCKSFAEYNGYHISVTFKQTDGQIKSGFLYMSSAYLKLDSLTNTDYLKKQFELIHSDGNGNIRYGKNRIYYEYSNQNSVKKIFKVIDITKIALKSIIEIKINDYISASYLEQISNKLSLADKEWINTKSLDKFSTYNYSCSFDIYVHENNLKIEKIKKELERKNIEWENIELNRDNQKKFDDEINQILDKLFEFKVLVIQFCSC